MSTCVCGRGAQYCQGDYQHYALITLRWIKLAREAGYLGAGSLPTEADVWHSSLLVRMADGKEPFPQPPPCYCSYPDYGLIETGERTFHHEDVWFLKKILTGEILAPGDVLPGYFVNLLQSIWKVKEVLSLEPDRESFIVEYVQPECAPGVWHLDNGQIIWLGTHVDYGLRRGPGWRLWREKERGF